MRGLYVEINDYDERRWLFFLTIWLKHRSENKGALTNRSSGKYREPLSADSPYPRLATLSSNSVWNESLSEWESRKRMKGDKARGGVWTNAGTNRTKPGCGESRQMFWIKQTMAIRETTHHAIKFISFGPRKRPKYSNRHAQGNPWGASFFSGYRPSNGSPSRPELLHGFPHRDGLQTH